MHLTEEQKQIVHMPYQSGKVVKIEAFAGTGKSTTLLEFAKANPSKRCLYLVFNRKLREEAESKFPPNVHCKTSHSLAYAVFGSKLNKSGKLQTKEWKPYLLKSWIGIDSDYLSYIVVETLKTFIASAEFEIEEFHIPKDLIRLKHKEATPNFVDNILSLSKKAWSRVTDETDIEAYATHDTYLKLYQLSKPRLNYDCILLDEAQDTTDCVIDVITKQQNAMKILVGDTHQSIYQWRKAVNAMEKIACDDVFPITKSFRFHDDIAADANHLLRVMKSEKKAIIGNGSVSTSFLPNHYRVVIGRTNSKLFDIAITTPGLIYWIGGFDAYPYDPVLNVYHLWSGDTDKIRDPFIKLFSDMMELKLYAEDVFDAESLFKIYLVEKYGFRLPGLLAQLKNRIAGDLEQASVVLTTAHRSKGLEWDCVELADDFGDCMYMSEFAKIIAEEELVIGDFPPKFIEYVKKILSPRMFMTEEANILYVAATRGKQKVILNYNTKMFIDLARSGIDFIAPEYQVIQAVRDFINKVKASIASNESVYLDRKDYLWELDAL